MMPMLSTYIHETVYNRFRRGFLWALGGSITYEALKLVHLFFLFRLLEPSLYGTMGTILGSIYFTMYVADAGVANSLLPFLHLCLKSRQHCKRFLLRYCLLPHFPFIVLCSTVLIFVISARVNLSTLPFVGFFIFGITILETMRTFARMFLYATFQARLTVTVEVSFFAFYVLALWIPYIVSSHLITLPYMFAIHALDSLLVSCFFFYLLRQFYYTLPEMPSAYLADSQALILRNEPSKASVSMDLFPATLPRRLVITRFFNYVLRLSRSFFSSNFLTPLFAVRFGLQSAGIFYFASMVASALYSVVKTSVGYSGSALLAHVKESSLAAKKLVFNELFNKLLYLVIPMATFIIINYHLIVQQNAQHSIAKTTVAFCLLFFFIQFTEFFFMIYEQFYILEEASGKLFLFKAFEMVMFFGFIVTANVASPLITLFGLVMLRLISLFIIAMNAFYLWRIYPVITIRRWHVFYYAGWVIVACIVRWISL